MEEIILVDENDNEIGIGEKIEVHKNSKLHRAFSIFVFNSRGELMLQKRSKSKYHAGDLWTNTCCGHPRPSEENEKAAHRKLVQEMGFDCDLEETFSFVYKKPAGNGLTEHEFLHVFIGNFEDQPELNPEEAEDWRWIDLEELGNEMLKTPEKYTPWLFLSMPKVSRYLNSRNIYTPLP